MKRLNLFLRWPTLRFLTVRPHDQKDNPHGYISVDGSEPIETVYALIKSGHSVAPLKKIEAIHSIFIGVKHLSGIENPIVEAKDIARALLAQNELLNRILIRRDFWTLSDFNDPELNQSFGIQNIFFDNYRWSQMLWKRFQQYVEEYYPISEHTHLTYVEYEELLRCFARFEKGVRFTPLTPKKLRLHSAYGVTVPNKFSMEPLLLLKQWLVNYKNPLMLYRGLVLNCGCGLSTFAVRHCGVPLVCGVDPRPRAVQACRLDAKQDRMFSTVKFSVSEFFPTMMSKSKFDLIVYYPDEDILETVGGSYSDIYAPNLAGYSGKIERFFDEAENHLSERGIVVICCTNLMSLLKPLEPHPIEYEVKVNRRYVILDYFDTPMRHLPKVSSLSASVTLPSAARQKLRSELWVLHKLEALEHFGYLHGIPGAQPPAIAGKWKGSKMSLERQKAFRRHAQSIGEDWGTYKSRLITMLQETNDVEEDDFAVAVRMSLDPSYPEELALRAKSSIEERRENEEQFHKSVASNFATSSPREVFDSKVL